MAVFVRGGGRGLDPLDPRVSSEAVRVNLHLLTVLACPSCGGEMAYGSLEDHPREGDEVEEGTLVCKKCKQSYPIEHGIPRLHPPEELEARVLRTQESFALEANQSTYIPIGAEHRLENAGQGPLRLIEVQSGDYLGEDDIERLEDVYGRS